MRPDTYGPDAVIADREEAQRVALGECAICACDLFDREELCDDCAHITCPQCHGTQIGYYTVRGNSIAGPCSECDGDGYVSRARRIKA